MAPEVWSSIILVAGGITFALVALLVTKSAFRNVMDGPEIRGRVAELEARSEQHGRDIKEALDTAIKARRIASKREDKAAKAEVVQTRRVAEQPNGGGGRTRDIFDAPPGYAGAAGKLPMPRARAPEPTDAQLIEDLGEIEELPEN